MEKIPFAVVAVCFVVLLSNSIVFGQGKKNDAQILSKEQIDKVFTETVKNQFNINYHVFRVYRYSDKSGEYYLVLTENNYKFTHEGDTLSHQIRALDFKNNKGGLFKQWEINDFTIKQVNGNGEEDAIWFWTKYLKIEDIDNDGLIDLVLVYGSWGTNGYDDGRIKMLTFYKGQKIAIRHQNGVLDDERNTQVDAVFYSLPIVFQNTVKGIMDRLTTDNHAIFPHGWEAAMKKHKLKFDERHQP